MGGVGEWGEWGSGRSGGVAGVGEWEELGSGRSWGVGGVGEWGEWRMTAFSLENSCVFQDNFSVTVVCVSVALKI